MGFNSVFKGLNGNKYINYMLPLQQTTAVLVNMIMKIRILVFFSLVFLEFTYTTSGK